MGLQDDRVGIEGDVDSRFRGRKRGGRGVTLTLILSQDGRGGRGEGRFANRPYEGIERDGHPSTRTTHPGGVIMAAI